MILLHFEELNKGALIVRNARMKVRFLIIMLGI